MIQQKANFSSWKLQKNEKGQKFWGFECRTRSACPSPKTRTILTHPWAEPIKMRPKIPNFCLFGDVCLPFGLGKEGGGSWENGQKTRKMKRMHR